MRHLQTLLFAASLSACQQTSREPAATAATPAATPTTTSAAMPAVTLTATPTAKPLVILELPDSRAGRFAREMLDVLNHGDAAKRRAFFEPRLTPRMLALVPLDELLVYLDKMAEQSGGVDVVKIEPSKLGPEALLLHLRARRVDRIVWMNFVLDEQDRISDMEVESFPSVKFDDPDVLPKVAMPEEQVAAAIVRRLEQLGAADRFSGVALVLKGDRELVRVIHGHAEKSFATPHRFDTKFNLGSMNKMFTAVAIGQLVEQGKLSFDDPLIKVLPDYPDRTFAERVTIHHLLTHTSGIGGNIFAPQMYERRDRYKRAADYLPLLDVPPEFPPGARVQYANPGFIVLGLVIERVSGESYDDYVEKHVFAPAGMPDTGSYAWDEVVPNLAVGYGHDPLDALKVEPRRTNIALLPYSGTPAGGGYSTVPDLRAFAAALRGHRLLGPEMTETITSPKVDFPGWGKYGYGVLSYAAEGRDVRGHDGGHSGISSALRMFWDGSYTVIVLDNYGLASGVATEIQNLLAAQSP